MPVREADFQPLLSLINIQLELNRNLLSLAQQQKECLIKNDVDTLDSLVRKQTTLVKQLAALERKRLDTAAGLKKALQLEKRPYTLGEMAQYAPKEQKEEAERVLNEFSTVLKALKDANDTNKLLLDTNIELNEMMLSMFVENDDPLNNLYHGDGSKAADTPTNPSLFDHNI